jgi:hypothetical protein
MPGYRSTALRIATLALCALACSGTASTVAPLAQSVVVTITPADASVAPLAQQTFTASVTGTADQSVTWSIAEGASGGTITSAGVYTASAVPGTFHVVATSASGANAQTTVQVTAAAVTVQITPSAVSLAPSASYTFSAAVAGTPNSAVSWAVQEGAAGGTVTSAGAYAAPAAAGTYHVVATSAADPTKSATATVIVSAVPVVVVAVSPGTAALSTGGQTTFSSIVTGSPDTAVTWSIQEGSAGGSITAQGVYTAPATAGTYHVVAKSHADPTKTAVATITVTAPAPVTIAVSPTSGSVDACKTLTFTANVTGSANHGVTWSVQEGSAGGSITAQGVYTAPSTAGVYHVVGTSQADSTKSAVVAVTVTDHVLSVSVSPASVSLQPGGTAQLTATVTTTCGQFTATQTVTAPAG